MTQIDNSPDAIVDAALGGNLDAVMQCRARGDGVNARDDLGMIALHVAAEEARRDIAEAILRNGTDVVACNAAGATPLDYAPFFNRPDSADLLRRRGAVDREGKSSAQYNGETEAIGWESMQSLHHLMHKLRENEPEN